MSRVNDNPIHAAEIARLRRLLARAEAALSGTITWLRNGPVTAPPLMIQIRDEIREALRD